MNLDKIVLFVVFFFNLQLSTVLSVNLPQAFTIGRSHFYRTALGEFYHRTIKMWEEFVFDLGLIFEEKVCGLDRHYPWTNHTTAEAHFRVISSVDKVELKLLRGWSHDRPFIQKRLLVEHFSFFFIFLDRDPKRPFSINDHNKCHDQYPTCIYKQP